MAIISFSDERAWVKARWAVSRVLSDMLAICGDDPQLKAELEQSLALGALIFDLLEPQVADRLARVLKDVITRTLNESEPSALTWKTGLDEERQSQYKEALRELEAMIDP